MAVQEIDRIIWSDCAVGLFSWLLSVGFSVIYIIFFQIDFYLFTQVAFGLSLSALVLVLPSLLSILLSFKLGSSFLLICDHLISLFFLLFLAMIGFYLPEIAGHVVVGVVCLFSLLSIFYAFFLYLKYPKVIASVLLILFIVVLVIVIPRAAIISTSSFPNAVDGLFSQRGVTNDYFFYSGILSMLKTHGIVSDGLLGLQTMKIYWGSEWVSAGFSNWLHLNSMNAIVWSFTVLFIPFFIKQALLLGLRINQYVKKDGVQQLGYTSLLVLVLLLTLLLSNYSIRAGVWQSIVSQATFTLSTGIVLVFVGVLFYLMDESAVLETQSRAVRLGIIVLVLPLLMLLIGWTKTSNLLIVGLLYGFIWLRFGLFRCREYNLSLFLSVMVTLLVNYQFKPTLYGAAGMQIDWFNFFKQYVPNIPLYLLSNFALLWLYLWLRILGAGSKLLSFKSWRQGLFFDLELCFVLAFVCVFLTSLWKIGGGSAGYFIEVFRVSTLFFSLFAVYQLLYSNYDSFIGNRHQ